jgi:AcrR family transcriptional regulator
MPRGRPRQFDTDQALDAALRLFWRHGYDGTSLAALSAAMRINMPSLYAAFGNKETLFKKVLERYLESPASYLPRALNQPTARLATETLYRGAIEMVMNPEHPDGCLLVHGALASGPDSSNIQRELSLRRAGAQAAVRRRYQRAIAEGDLPPSTDPDTLARYVVTLLWGLSVQAAGGATRQHLEQVAAFAMQSFPA